ncbi:subclass B3 metallo-beta-lactamase [Aurantiacibacter sediminis]|uniref:Subclass B3 metallo-beta-lactamase n=1 Tax=Aurantiacibacter sediminis TaxID=2793064 RepID=A0ABS0N356_9SPHN|nr:subclass B3 metallo-beta-lactamase [Aurantiacibacter sediminis]MBH5322399.1 subclass B3 metallo-beta-lactamase [Aurantiacibacter sediminis]
MSAKLLFAAPLCLAACAATPMAAQEQERVWNEQITFAEDCEEWDEWDKPANPFRIFGDTYYVGTCGIAAILIVDDEGHVLLDSGTEAGARVVERNIRRVGVNPEDILLLGYSHEHFDHVGGMAYLQEMSGASLVSLATGAEVMRTGNSDPADPQHGMHEPFTPVRVDFVHDDGDAMAVGPTQLRSFATPGHTPGATTWQWESCEGDLCRTIVYADSLSAVSADDYRFSDHPEYVQAYRNGIARLAALDCDILITPHPSASGMRQKLMADDLTSGMDCAAYAADRLEHLEARLASEVGE